MTTKEFVGYYKMAKDKKAECAKRVKNKYVPFTTKIAECSKIVKATMDYNGVPNVTTPMRFLLFHMTLLKFYTDLELSDDVITEYDLLNEAGTLDGTDGTDGLIGSLPVHEYKEFTTLLNMCVDDYISNNRDLVAYIENKLNVLMQLVPENKEEKTEE